VDLNRDGHMDFVALLAQEHETVVAFINKGAKDFTFDQKGHLHGAASQLGLVGHSARGHGRRRGSRRAPDARRHRSTTGS
jgi:hypothetical protein